METVEFCVDPKACDETCIELRGADGRIIVGCDGTAIALSEGLAIIATWEGTWIAPLDGTDITAACDWT